MEKKTIVEQTKLAFDFIQKLYFEVSYLIKEVEGILAEEKENFVIGRPSGYSVNYRSSTGLEPQNVNLWPVRKMSVFFVPESDSGIRSGKTITPFTSKLKILYLRIILDDKELVEPSIYFGVLFDFQVR